jgi:hypothetical protein
MVARSLRPRSRCAHGLLVAIATISLSSAARADVEVVAIVNEGNTIETITLNDVRLLFGLYRRSWDGGVRVVLILPKGGSPAMNFLTGEIFRKRDTRDIEDYYLTAAFQQRIAVQPRAASDRLATALVRSEPGAIALIERVSTAAPGVRMLEILRE